MLCDKVLDYSRKTKLKDRGLLYKTRKKCEVNLKVFKILILIQKLIVFLFFFNFIDWPHSKNKNN
jgi:hypothetical protein